MIMLARIKRKLEQLQGKHTLGYKNLSGIRALHDGNGVILQQDLSTCVFINHRTPKSVKQKLTHF